MIAIYNDDFLEKIATIEQGAKLLPSSGTENSSVSSFFHRVAKLNLIDENVESFFVIYILKDIVIQAVGISVCLGAFFVKLNLEYVVIVDSLGIQMVLVYFEEEV